MPAISPESLYGAVYLPATATSIRTPRRSPSPMPRGSWASRIRQNTRVTGFELGPRREIRRVLLEGGEARSIDRARRERGRDVGAARGRDGRGVHPVDPGRSSARRAARGAGSRAAADMPCFRDPDNLVYGKAEHGGMLFGGYEAEPNARWLEGVPWEHAATSLPPDWDRFQPLMEGAIRRFPFLADAEAVRLVCHPDAMTPDSNPLIGPMPGVRGFWVAAGLSLNGFGGGGGIGRAVAGWITAGDPGVDIAPYRAWRFADTYRDPGWTSGLARETYADYYRLRFPYDADRRRPAAAAVRAQRAPRGGRRRVRHEGRLGARGPPPARPAVDAERPHATGARVGTARLVRSGGGGASGRPRAGRDHRPDLVRQDRRLGPGRAGAAPAGVRERRRQARRLDDLRPVPRRQWGHRRRRHRRRGCRRTTSAC